MFSAQTEGVNGAIVEAHTRGVVTSSTLMAKGPAFAEAGYNDPDLHAAKTRLRESRETELQVLTLRAAREALSQNGIDLISYHDL